MTIRMVLRNLSPGKFSLVQACVDGILAKIAKDARTPRLLKIYGHLIYRRLGALASLGALGEKIVRQVP
jgi:hypothetical protein